VGGGLENELQFYFYFVLSNKFRRIGGEFEHFCQLQLLNFSSSKFDAGF